MEEFEVSRAYLTDPDQFPRFSVGDQTQILRDLNLDPNESLIIVERAGIKRAFLTRQICYHHVAQGKIGDIPFVLAFCVICHSGMGFNPVIKNKLHHFSAGGLYDGTVLLIDDESRTYWNHITGRGLHGLQKGVQLEAFPLQMTTSKAAIEENQDFEVSIAPYPTDSKKDELQKRFDWYGKNQELYIHGGARLPEFFPTTMGKGDDRLPTMTNGLGVIEDGIAVFFQTSKIQNPVSFDIRGKQLLIHLNKTTKIPKASWKDDDSVPMQLFTRWYGFSYAYPNAVIY